MANKSTKAKTKKTNSSPRMHWVVGTLFSVIGLWIFAAFFTFHSQGIESNWLGPYLGSAWISGLLDFFGHVSILLLYYLLYLYFRVGKSFYFFDSVVGFSFYPFAFLICFLCGFMENQFLLQKVEGFLGLLFPMNCSVFAENR